MSDSEQPDKGTRASGASGGPSLVSEGARADLAGKLLRLEAYVAQARKPADAWVTGEAWTTDTGDGRGNLAQRLESLRAVYFTGEKDGKIRVKDEPLEVAIAAWWPKEDYVSVEPGATKSGWMMAGVPCQAPQTWPKALAELWGAVFMFLPQDLGSGFISTKRAAGALSTIAGSGAATPFAGVGTLAAYYGEAQGAVLDLFLGYSRAPEIKRIFCRRTEHGVETLPDTDPDVVRVREGLCGLHQSRREMDKIHAKREQFWASPDSVAAPPPLPVASMKAKGPRGFWARLLDVLFGSSRRGGVEVQPPEMPLRAVVRDTEHVPRDPGYVPLLRAFRRECDRQAAAIEGEMQRFAQAMTEAQERLDRQDGEIKALHDRFAEITKDAAAWAAMLQTCAASRARVAALAGAANGGAA